MVGKVAYRIISSYKNRYGVSKRLSIYGSPTMPPDLEATFIRNGVRTTITYTPIKVEQEDWNR